ncbi:hypothetical protein B0A55_09704 [Friedmanniomyces simplex]|uniref:Uncharacterized protein n=1 Tax=Friedmanniomyces simplex TaxID=329884 RepID=A0A4U0X0Y4_9PEZI|nr:hypothetical protein B0A55_09704 [Friedmanniomyces simplex]
MQMLSYAGAATALLAALPASVQSYAFRCHLNVIPWTYLRNASQNITGYLPFGIDNQPNLGCRSAALPNPHLMHFTTGMLARATQMRQLNIDIRIVQNPSFNYRLEEQWRILRPPYRALAYWRNVLRSMPNLQHLVLTNSDSESLDERLPYLDALFTDLVMPGVTHLRLEGWVITLPLVSQRLWAVFPNLKGLVLEAIIRRVHLPKRGMQPSADCQRAKGARERYASTSWTRDALLSTRKGF